MKKPFARIGADGVDTTLVMRDVEEAVASGESAEQQADAVLKAVGDLDIKTLADNTQILSHVIAHMRESAMIDIGEFKIVNTGGPFGRLEAAVKRVIWKLLRFYTFRMFTQQRAFNMQVAAVLEAMWRRLENLER